MKKKYFAVSYWLIVVLIFGYNTLFAPLNPPALIPAPLPQFGVLRQAPINVGLPPLVKVNQEQTGYSIDSNLEMDILRSIIIPFFWSAFPAILTLVITGYTCWKTLILKDLFADQKTAPKGLPNEAFPRARLQILKLAAGGGPGLNIMISNRTKSPHKLNMKLIDACVSSETNGPVPRLLPKKIAEGKDDVCYFKIKEEWKITKLIKNIMRKPRKRMHLHLLYGLGSDLPSSNHKALGMGCFLIIIIYEGVDKPFWWSIKEPFRDNFDGQTPRILHEDFSNEDFFHKDIKNILDLVKVTQPENDLPKGCKHGEYYKYTDNNRCSIIRGKCDIGETLYSGPVEFSTKFGKFKFAIETENCTGKICSTQEDSLTFILLSADELYEWASPAFTHLMAAGQAASALQNEQHFHTEEVNLFQSSLCPSSPASRRLQFAADIPLIVNSNALIQDQS